MIKSTEQLRGMRGNYATYEDLVMRCCDIADEIEREVEEGYVELPKDDNGDVWRVGDLVIGEVNPNNPKRVERMLWYGPDSGWQLETDTIIFPCPERVRHHHAPTVEDVLREFTDAILEWAGESGTVAEVGTWSDVAADFAKRLQLKEEQ